MSDQAPVQLIVAAFDDETIADAVLEGLKDAQAEGLIQIRDAAVVRRDINDKLHIKETGDWSGKRGAVTGGVIGAVVGLVAGPIGWAALGGAALGGVLAKVRDSGIPDDRLRELGSALRPGTSAIVALVEHTWVVEVEQRMIEEGAHTARQELNADIAEQLAQHRDVVYSAVVDQGGNVLVARATTAGPDDVEAATADGAASPDGGAIPADGGATPAPEAAASTGGSAAPSASAAQS